MTTVVAAPTSTATALALSSTPPHDRSSSPLRYAGLPPPRSFPSHKMSSARDSAPAMPRSNSTSAPTPPMTAAPAATASRGPRSSPRSNGSPDSANRSPPSRNGSDGKASPNANRAPIIRVKKEPASPNMTHSRPRPRRLDLSSSASASRGPQTAGANPSAPLQSKESAGLAIKDLGVACLSPGFQTQDPQLREQLQRSLSVRDRQRQIIEARQKGSNKPLTSHDQIDSAQRPDFDSARDGPQTSRRKGPPPGLSIHAPSASSFAHERVIQSAPLHQSFTGLRSHNAHPPPPSNLGQYSHIHQVPPPPSNRLPPISDVFAQDRLDPPPPSASFRPAQGGPAPSPGHPPMHSPGYPPHHHQHSQQREQGPPQPPPSAGARQREFRSAEEAVQGMSGGREELLPKIVHYGGAQPPTPPSPHHPQQGHAQHHGPPHHHHHHGPPQGQQQYAERPDFGRTQSVSGRRRGREEYERDNPSGSPAVYGGEFKRRAEEGDWRSGMGGREKREEFLRLCERAWDLFHS